ncbi:MAG: menaquinone biosynthesis family protein [Thermodesulfobacteriota bacterium]
MNRRITLGFSTCPNDTFIFHALVHQLVPCEGIRFAAELKDVESLNQEARAERYDVSKLSFAAIGRLLDRYGLLRSGAALGRGCGPLLVARPGTVIRPQARQVIAVPGLWTTANLLLGLFLPKPPMVMPMPFDLIMPSVREGKADMGVIIHEGRFTYGEYGLAELCDLGAWWEERTSLPIPLGGIAIHRRTEEPIGRKIEEAIAASVRHAKQFPEASREYVHRHAREMSPAVIRQHISLYVNDFSIDVGGEGEKAIRLLFAKAAEKGLIPPPRGPLFAFEGKGRSLRDR